MRWEFVATFEHSCHCSSAGVDWRVVLVDQILRTGYTVELQWLEHLWDHENMFETGVVRASEG